MLPQRQIWLDADPGLDDWLTMLLIQAQPHLSWVGMSVVFGNAPLGITRDNALRIRALHSLNVPVFAGAEQPLQMPMQTAQQILGVQGMRTTGQEIPATAQTCDGNQAVESLLNHLRQGGQTTLLATGPLTNIAQAIVQDRAAMNAVEEIVWMGGSTDIGNHTAVAEFNAYADPESAALVLGSGVPIRMFGLNVCRQLLLTRKHVERLHQLPGPVAACVAGYVDAYQRIRSPDGAQPMPLYDPVVALWLMRPDLFGFSDFFVDVELQGDLTRGMTVCDQRRKPSRPANAKVAMSVQSPLAMSMFMQSLCEVLS